MGIALTTRVLTGDPFPGDAQEYQAALTAVRSKAEWIVPVSVGASFYGAGSLLFPHDGIWHVFPTQWRVRGDAGSPRLVSTPTWVVDEACGSASSAYAPPPGAVQCERAVPGVSDGPEGETWRVRASSLAFTPSFANVTIEAVRRAFRDAMMIPPGGSGARSAAEPCGDPSNGGRRLRSRRCAGNLCVHPGPCEAVDVSASTGAADWAPVSLSTGKPV